MKNICYTAGIQWPIRHIPEETMKEAKNKYFTVPNLLSLLRLGMIPLLLWLYLRKKSYLWTAAVLLLSGATDVLDGIIARKWNMASDLGKALDPVADKLTQAVMLFCLGITYPEIRLLLLIMVLKEGACAVMSLLAIRKTGQIQGAQWHGKVTTVLLYLLILDRILPGALSALLTLACGGTMVLSAILYVRLHLQQLRGKG